MAVPPQLSACLGPAMAHCDGAVVPMLGCWHVSLGAPQRLGPRAWPHVGKQHKLTLYLRAGAWPPLARRPGGLGLYGTEGAAGKKGALSAASSGSGGEWAWPWQAPGADGGMDGEVGGERKESEKPGSKVSL